jgi:hypothetical protein
MENMNSNYQILINKLDEFIRKYYKNQLIRGALYTFTISLLFYLTLTVGEYFGHFNTAVRTSLFYTFLLTNAYVIGRFVALPLFHLYKLGTIISYEQASNIIGNHFGDVKDKLTNTLQLNSLQRETNDPNTAQLIEASINQKTRELKPIPFTSAIDLTENKKYLKFALVPVMLMLGLFFINSSILKDGTKRMMEHGTYFEKPAPFTFEVLNKDLKAVQQEDFRLDVKIVGNEVPENAYIEIGGNQFKLEKENNALYHYDFKNVQKDIAFHLTGNGFSSKEYDLKAIPNPLVLTMEAAFEYPAYTGKTNDKLQNTGDFNIPAGTKVNWKFLTRNTDALKMIFKEGVVDVHILEENKFGYAKRFMESDNYAISTSNAQLKSKDSIRYSVTVIPDLYPTINVEQQKDSLSSKRYFFKGVVKDDYGFNKLNFVYKFLKTDDSSINKGKEYAEAIPVNKNATQDQFFYFWDASNLKVGAGDEIEYFFEIWDNDGVNGSKATRSATYIFKAPTLKEIEQTTGQKNDAIKQDLKQTIDDAKKLEKELNDINKDMFDKKSLNWEDKKKIEDVIKKEEKLQDKAAEIQKENQQKQANEQEYKKENEEILQKQDELNKLMDKMMTPELKKMMEELKKLMENMDKQKIQDKLEEMKYSNKEIEKEMDRTLEIFKKMELEKKYSETVDNLKKLADEQEKLAEKTQEKNLDKDKKDKDKSADKDKSDKDKAADKDKKDKAQDKDKAADKAQDKDANKTDAEKKQEELERKQDELGKSFEDIKKDIKAMEKMNQELSSPEKMENTDKEQKDISEDQKDSKESLDQKQNEKASKSQKNAASKMKKMAEKMESSAAANAQEKEGEDEASLRALLENLIRVSFNQEDLMGQLASVDVANPQYLKIGKDQRKLKDDMKMIEDSLTALARRVSQISSTVNKEVSSINKNIDKSLDYFEDRKIAEARSNQQYAMTSMNNLALLLSEALNSMQQQESQSKAGSGSCKKPGKGKKKSQSLSEIKKMQDNLADAIKKLKEEQKKGENGKKPGGKDGKEGQGGNKPGGEKGQGEGQGMGENGKNGMNEQLAKLAAQQAAIRNAVNELNGTENRDGKGSTGDLGKLADQMEKVQKDIVNNNISQETLDRVDQIKTRLLESERAEKEREQDEKRESKSGKDVAKRNPFDLDEYKRLKLKEIELLKTMPPSLSPYYRQKVDQYFQSIQN